MKTFRPILFSSTFAAFICVSTASHVLAETAPKVVPPATEEMQHPEFWIKQIKGDPDRVFLTPAQIKDLNTKNRTRSSLINDINGNPYSIQDVIDLKDIIGVQYRVEDPLTIKTFSGDSLKVRFKRVREYFESRRHYDRRNIVYDNEMRRELYDKTDQTSIPDVINPLYGILVKHTLNRILPTSQAAYPDQNGWLDYLQSTSVDYGTPVAILHATKDKDWYYVRSDIAFGWVPAENIAFGTREDIERFTKAENFIVITGHKSPIFADESFSTYITDAYLGARIPLLNQSPAGYQVLVPYRDIDASLKSKTGWIRHGERVSVGYQAFTQRNIINTLFTLLYRPYAWADSNNERDCCGTIRAVYRTFGIMLPRWTSHELHCTDNIYAFPRETDRAVKYNLLKSCEPALTLVGDSGHISMYLGVVNGIYYVIHQSGYSYTAEDGTEMLIRRVNVNDTELVGGSNITLWTEISEFKP